MALSLVKNVFKRHPLLANSVVYGTLYVGAEFSQQVEKEAQQPIDTAVLARYAVVGSVINSNYLFAWYKWLDSRYVGISAKIITKKLLLDQFLMTPPLYVIFYSSMSLMEGKDDLLEECRQKFGKTFATSCVFWIPAQAINFIFLPPAARVVYMGACSFAWVNVLCWIKRSQA